MDYRRKEKSSKQTKGGSWRGFGQLRDLQELGESLGMPPAMPPAKMVNTGMYRFGGNCLSYWLHFGGMELDEASGVQKFHTLNFKTLNMEYLLRYFCLRLVVDRMRVISHNCFCCTGTILIQRQETFNWP